MLCSRRPAGVTGGEVPDGLSPSVWVHSRLLFSLNVHLLCPSGTSSCMANGTSSSSFYAIAMASVPECVDSGTQTDITFQNVVAVGRSRARLHHHQHQQHCRGRSPSPPPPSPSPPHLTAPEGMGELYVLACLRWSRPTGSVRSDG